MTRNGWTMQEPGWWTHPRFGAIHEELDCYAILGNDGPNYVLLGNAPNLKSAMEAAEKEGKK